jgi:hypothetical protein
LNQKVEWQQFSRRFISGQGPTIDALEWLTRVRAEERAQQKLARQLAASRRRRAQALADGVDRLKTAAGVGRLLNPPISGQAVSKYIRDHLPTTSSEPPTEGEPGA